MRGLLFYLFFGVPGVLHVTEQDIDDGYGFIFNTSVSIGTEFKEI